MSVDLNAKCRTCLNESNTYYQLFDYAEDNCKILEMLDCIVPQINIKSTSQLSTLVCQMCVEKLLIGYKFQQLCLLSDKRLRDLLGIAEIDAKQENEVIVDPLEPTELVLKQEIEGAICIESAMKSDNDWFSNSCCAVTTSASICQTQPYIEELKLEYTAIEVKNKGDNDLIQPRIFRCRYCPKRFEKKMSLSAHCKVHKSKGKESINLVSDSHNILESVMTAVKAVAINKEPQTLDDDPEDNLNNKLAIMSGPEEIKEQSSSDSGSANVEQMSNSSNIVNEFDCKLCGKKFDRPYSLRRHNSTVHSLARPYECEICTYRFSDAKLLKTHLFQHNTEEGYKCEECQHNFISMKQLTKHFKNQHPKVDKHTCNYCKRKFTIRKCLLNHISNRHKSDEKLPCQICKKVYGTAIRLQQHMRIHTESYLCPHCGKTFHGSSNIRAHMERHKGLKKYQCPDCPKRFNCSSDVSKHALTHSNAKPHICDICGSRFRRKDSMHKHKLLHTAERRFKCDQCSMTFKLISLLKRHMRTHTGEKPYKCKYCERAYSESGDLTKHLRTHVGENTYICDQCPMAYKYKVELQHHQNQHYKMDQKLPQTTPEKSEELLHENNQTAKDKPLDKF